MNFLIFRKKCHAVSLCTGQAIRAGQGRKRIEIAGRLAAQSGEKAARNLRDEAITMPGLPQ